MNVVKVNIFWFRRDLRLDDNTALYYALSGDLPVLAVFIFDKNILSHIEDNYDLRVNFIYEYIIKLKKELETYGSTLKIYSGTPVDVFHDIIKNYAIHSVYANHDYEPYGIERDHTLKEFFHSKDIAYKTFKDIVIFEKDEITKADGSPYTVYTPYSKKWLAEYHQNELISNNCEILADNFYKIPADPFTSICTLGFKRIAEDFPKNVINKRIIKTYHLTRDFPGYLSTTRIGIHLRFGTISIRQLANTAAKLNYTFLNELIWREFFMQILYHFPFVTERSFKEVYDHIQWKNDEQEFAKWCEGKTGYPFVDAGMRELNQTGFMHNRTRMVTASFLSKHLLIDWRWGEAYFASKLLDYELSSNNGNWQWAAGTGCDSAPYFRIFNPISQQKKFDPKGKYISAWLPEYGTPDYPTPIVEHDFARKRCLDSYKKALGK